MSKQNGTLRGTGWIMIKFQGFQTYVAEFSVILVLKSEDRYLRILKHPTKSEEILPKNSLWISLLQQQKNS